MILYSERDNHYSHRVRIVLAEKDIACEIREFNIEDAPDDILSVNPYHKLPILIDRDLGLYDTAVMMEYLDERFPHPPLLPVYPVARANCRELMLRIDREWCPLIDSIISGKLTKAKAKNAKTTHDNNIRLQGGGVIQEFPHPGKKHHVWLAFRFNVQQRRNSNDSCGVEFPQILCFHDCA